MMDLAYACFVLIGFYALYCDLNVSLDDNRTLCSLLVMFNFIHVVRVKSEVLGTSLVCVLTISLLLLILFNLIIKFLLATALLEHFNMVFSRTMGSIGYCLCGCYMLWITFPSLQEQI